MQEITTAELNTLNFPKLEQVQLLEMKKSFFTKTIFKQIFNFNLELNMFLC